jgi:hypothetical protein
LNGSYGSSGTSGQNGSGGTSGTGVTLSLNDAGNTTVSDIRAVTFGSGFTLASAGTYSASITVSGFGTSAVPGTVSSSAQIVGFDLFATTTGSNKFFSTQAINGNVNITGSLNMTGLFTASLTKDYVWVGSDGGINMMVHKNTLTSSAAGGTGTGSAPNYNPGGGGGSGSVGGGGNNAFGPSGGTGTCSSITGQRVFYAGGGGGGGYSFNGGLGVAGGGNSPAFVNSAGNDFILPP